MEIFYGAVIGALLSVVIVGIIRYMREPDAPDEVEWFGVSASGSSQLISSKLLMNGHFHHMDFSNMKPVPGGVSPHHDAVEKFWRGSKAPNNAKSFYELGDRFLTGETVELETLPIRDR